MQLALASLVSLVLTSGVLLSCVAVAIPQQTPEQELEAYNRERYQAKVYSITNRVEDISGFWRLARVYSATMGSVGVAMSPGSPRDLDTIIDSVNEFTNIEAEFAGDIPFSHPGLLDLPIIVPQSEPNQVEMEQLVRYLLEGGFIFDIDLGLDIYREGLEKYGGLVWGRDAWIESLPDDHGIYFSYFQIEGGLPQIRRGPAAVRGEGTSARPMRGLFVNDRLVGINFSALGKQDALPGTRFDGNTVLQDTQVLQDAQVDEQIIQQRNQYHNDPKLRQILVNTVLYALTQEGSIAQRP